MREFFVIINICLKYRKQRKEIKENIIIMLLHNNFIINLVSVHKNKGQVLKINKINDIIKNII